MLYIIDGYNFLFRLLNPNEDLRKAREGLIASLVKKISHAKLRTILVFDSKYQPGFQSEKKVGNLLVVYTSEGETADEWILQKAKKGDSTAVTSDKRLAAQIRHKGAHTLSCEAFVAYLNKKMKLRAQRSKSENRPLLPPSKTKRVKGSLEYYQKMFETGVEIKAESERDRWLRIFGA